MQRKKNEPSVEIWGTGKPVRDWLYVKDAAAGILRSSEVYNDIEPLNIASGVGISVADLARTIKKAIGYEGKLVFNTSKPDGAMKKTFGIKKMKAELNWIPQTSLEIGIKETVAWYETHQQ
jgi:GDP-L-fucose synthase